jgi:hypothetical protein
LGEGGGFIQYSRGLSLLIPTKTLVPNKALGVLQFLQVICVFRLFIIFCYF